MSEISKRGRQIADLVKHEIAKLFKREVRDPRLTNITIVSVDVSPDLSNARIYYTILDKNELAAAKVALEKIQGYLRRLLSQEAKLRKVPQLRFIYDESVMAAEELSNLINKAVKDNESNEPT